jgi:hypothetical protein
MLKNALADTAMWDSAVTDVDAETHARLLAKASVALSGTWPFLAASGSQEEFEHRLALVQESIERSTPVEILGEVVAGLKDKFTTLHQARLTSHAQRRTAARSIAVAEGQVSLPEAYVHVHAHKADEGDSEYWQIDHVASPSFINTIAHVDNRDDALAQARQFNASAGLPLYENGKHIEGSRHDQYIFHAASRSWVPLRAVTAAADGDASSYEDMVGQEYNQFNRSPDWELNNIHKALNMMPFLNGQREKARLDAVKKIKAERRQKRQGAASFRDGMPGMGNGWTADLLIPQDWDGTQWVPGQYRQGSLQATAHQQWRAGGNQVVAVPGMSDAAGHARMQANWGDSHRPAQKTADAERDSTPHIVTYSGGEGTGRETYHADNRGDAEQWASHVQRNGGTVHGISQRTGAYQPDPDQAWRYRYPVTPVQPGVGGQPTGPAIGQGAAQPETQTTMGPDGFPLDVAAGEYDGAAAKMQQILTPGQWVAPAGGWPAGDKPNAATGMPQGQYPGAGNPARAASAGSPDFSRRTAQARECDIHKYEKGQSGVPAKYDGKTVYGPWANMCEDCAKTHGVDQPGGPLLRPLKQASRGPLFYFDQVQAARRVTADEYGNKSTDDFHDYGGPPADAKGHVYRRIGGRSGSMACQNCGIDKPRSGEWVPSCHEVQNGFGDFEASRRQASEGIVPSPGPNPNYFSQGTQGIQGPDEFPENPSADIEPKTNNHVDDLYGDVPPQMSPGSSQGQVDGGGYSRQGAKQRFEPGYPYMEIHPAQTYNQDSESGEPFALHEVRMVEGLHPEDHFTVGNWPADTVEQKAAEYGQAYLQGHGHSKAQGVPIHRVTGGLRTRANKYIKQQDGKWVITQKGTGKVLSHHDSEEEAEASFRAMMQSKHGSRLGFSRGAGRYDMDREEGHEHALRGQPVAYYPAPGGYLDGHEQGVIDREQLPPEEQDWHARQAALPWSNNPGSGWESAEERQRAQPQPVRRVNPVTGRAELHYDEAVQHDPRQAATDGKIVGMCDHCSQPVRYHTEQGGHLRHLHNGAAKCSDGKVATAMIVEAGGGYEARFKVSPFFQRTAATEDRPVEFLRAVPHEPRGECEFGDGRAATHTLHQSNGSSMTPIGEACESHAGQYDGHRVAARKLAFGDEHVTRYVDWAQQRKYDPDEVGTLQRYEREPGVGRAHTDHIADQLYIGGGGQDWRRQAAVLENPSAENPTGRGEDPYRSKTTWEGFQTQRPRQQMEGPGGMNANTPTTAPDALKTPQINSPTPRSPLDEDGPRERSDQDEEDDDDND